MSLLLCQYFGHSLAPDAGISNQSFTNYLLSIAGELRLQMHTTRIFYGVFAAVGIAGLLWIIAEKWQAGSKWNRPDALWLGGFIAVLAVSSMVYGLGTHSAVARRNAIPGALADMLGIAVVVAVPMVLWFRWHKTARGPEDREDHEESVSLSSSHYSRTVLGLQDYAPPRADVPRPIEAQPAAPVEAKTAVEVKAVPVAEADPEPGMPDNAAPASSLAAIQTPVHQPAAWLEGTLNSTTEPPAQQISTEVTSMDNKSTLNLNSPYAPTQPEAVQPSAPAHFAPTEPMTSHSFPAQSIAPPAPSQAYTQQPSTPTPAPAPMTGRPVSPAASFREQLMALNASWRQIEDTGKEIEDWFQRQQRRVMAHLERPAYKTHEGHVELSRDFLEPKMDKVDAEWARIHQTVREMYRWLENGSAEREAPQQEAKVW